MELTNMKILEHNVATGVAVEREMTKEELAQNELDKAAQTAKKAAADAQATTKAALLQRLGLTADEAALLLA
jgi:hypothetical protein